MQNILQFVYNTCMTDNKTTSGSQWIIDTVYPGFEEFRPIIDNPPQGEDYSNETVAFGSKQYPIWGHSELSKVFKHRQFASYVPHPAWDEAAGNLMVWTIAKLKEHGIEDEIIPAISWFIDYQENGWQSMHTHDNKCITQIIYMDNAEHFTEISAPKDAAYGAMYAVLGNEEKPKYRTYVSRAGRCIIMTGNILHGVYPVKTTPRRSIVVDYLIIK